MIICPETVNDGNLHDRIPLQDHHFWRNALADISGLQGSEAAVELLGIDIREGGVGWVV